MVREIKKVFAVTSVAALTIGMVGCGNSSDSASSDSTSTDSGSKVIQVVLCSGQAPYAYADDDGNPAGFDYEVLKKIDDELDQYTFEYQVLDQDAALVGTQQGTYDLATASFFKTDSREETYACSDAFNYGFCVLVSPQGSGISSWEDCDGKTMVPVTTSDGLYSVYTSLTEKYPDVNVDFEPSSSFVPYAEQFNGLNEGRWDFALEIEGAYSSIADQFDFTLDETDYVGAGECVFLMNKDQTQLQQDVNGAIKDLIDNDALSSLSEEYLGKDNYAIARKLGYID